MRRRTLTAATLVVVAAIAPVTISSALTERGVAETASATDRADRTGVIVTTQTTPTTTTTTTTTTPPPVPSSSEAEQVLALVNQERTSRGLQPMTLSSQLNRAAQGHTADQANASDIYHVAPNGTGPGDRIAATGYAFSTWGENVAAGYRTAQSVMDGWMTSPGHCRNILNPAFTELGVGYLVTSNSYRIWWTQKFARPSGVDRPAGTYDPAWC